MNDDMIIGFGAGVIIVIGAATTLRLLAFAFDDRYYRDYRGFVVWLACSMVAGLLTMVALTIWGLAWGVSL